MNDLTLQLIQYGLMLVAASLVIMYACNPFEQASGYLGRNLNAGAKGSLVDAIGSSLPELLVTMMFVISGKPELILAGVAVTAGSSIFNSCLIPALSIFAARDENGNKIKSLKLNKRSIAVQGFWLLLVEGVLIYFLGFSSFTLLMVGTLLALYVMYVMHTISESKKAGSNGVEDYEYESLEPNSKIKAALTFDFNSLLFGDQPFTSKTAWIVLGLAVFIIGVACHYLAVSVEGLAIALGVPVYFSAVVFGAAATSVPDTILSIKSARNGEADDALGNAIGSNVFDVTVALALPISIYLLIEGGALPMMQDDQLTMLRWFVLGTSSAVVASMYLMSDNITKKTALILIGLYASFMGYIGYAVM